MIYVPTETNNSLASHSKHFLLYIFISRVARVGLASLLLLLGGNIPSSLLTYRQQTRALPPPLFQMAPSRFASLRGRSQSQSQSQSSGHVPSYSADDSHLQQLVAFRYEQTIQAELPIPIPPPRNPLRLSRRPTAKTPPASRSRSASTITTASRTTRHVLVPPPLPASEDHPAFRVAPLQLRRHHQNQGHSETSSRTSSSIQHSPSSSTADTDWRRDSALETASSAATTLPDGEEEDPSSSVYSTDAEADADGQATIQEPRVSCQSRWSVTESDIDDSVSVSFREKEKKATRRLIRGLSLRLAPPVNNNKRNSRSKRQTTPGQAASEAVRAAYAAMAPMPAAAASPHGAGPPTTPQSGRSHHSQLLQDSPALHSLLSPNLTGPLPLPQRLPPASRPGQEIGTTDSQSPVSRDPGPLSRQVVHHAGASDLAPIINTDISEGDFSVDTRSFEFSNRGSLLMGGKRVVSISRPLPSSSPSSLAMDKFAEPRPAPAAPTLSARRASAMAMLVAKNPSLPDIRVLPDETERESQKVRSLYESTDLMHWQDGAPGCLSGEPLSSPSPSPSDGRQDNLAYGFPFGFQCSYAPQPC